MANLEDISGSDIEKKPVLKETTEVVNDEYVSPDWESLRQNKGVAKKKLVRCQGSGNCTLPAIVRPEFKETGPKNLCQIHWDRVKNNVESYEPAPMYLTRNLDDAADIRGEDAVAAKQGKSRINKDIFNVTGAYVHMQGPGRPIKTESEKADLPVVLQDFINRNYPELGQVTSAKPVDQVTPVIDKAATGGGHYPVDHVQKLDAAYKALSHSIFEGGGEVNKDAYHKKAHELGITDENERNQYFIHAMTRRAKALGPARAVPGPNIVEQLSSEVSDNPTTISPNSYDEYSDLMAPDAPSARDVGLKKGQLPSTDTD